MIAANMFAVRQHWPSLVYRVVPVPSEQGRSMVSRGDKHLYPTRSQAEAVAGTLERERASRTPGV